MEATGWCVVGPENLYIRTVSPTRRAAIVNWLVTEGNVMVYNMATDEQIEQMFAVLGGTDMTVERVKIIVMR